ncbi:hypothetical protein EHS16_05215, partial [Streptococcus anginosus]
LLSGLVSFFLLFFYVLMEFYQLRVAQFYFTSLFFFVIFQFFCEAFVGVMSSVGFFRYYFYSRIDNAKAMSSGVVFYVRD